MEGWQQKLRGSGYRLTPQRQLVLQAVNALGHGTPDEICARVRETADGVNISTVYRTLELLEELELVTHTHLGHGAPTYHSTGEPEHLHLVCRDCGAVEEADIELAQPLSDLLSEAHGFDVDLTHFAIFGRCSRCTA